MSDRSSRRRALRGIVASGALAGGAPWHAALAQAAYPTRQVTVVMPYAAGGPTDVATRAVVRRMAEDLKQSVVVEARPGAGANIAVEAVLAAPRDGYTWLVSSNFLFVNPAMDPAVKWKYEDFVPVARYALSPSYFLVPADAPFATLADWVAHARRNPGVQYGNGGVGTTQSMSMSMLMRTAGAVSYTHLTLPTSDLV